jgi:hypothetical protein
MTRRFLTLVLLSALPGVSPVPASARRIEAPPRTDWNSCALDAQKAVARRHHLAMRDDAALGTVIYADPLLSREADDAFDACVRKP